MKKTFLLLFTFILLKVSFGQVLCVQCFRQNDSIGVGVGSHNLIVNGGFENSNCIAGYVLSYFCPNSSGYDCDSLE
jgi:hypothetical protein